MMKFPVAGGVPWVGSCGRPPVMVPIAVFWTKSKSSKSTAPGTELVVAPGLMVTEMAFAGLAASTHAPATSAAINIDFMAVTPLNEPPQPPPASLLQSSFVNSLRVHFLDKRCGCPIKSGRCDLRVNEYAANTLPAVEAHWLGVHDDHPRPEQALGDQSGGSASSISSAVRNFRRPVFRAAMRR